MKLMDIKIVDLKNSVLDEKLSKPEKGEFAFKSKRYISYQGKGARPNWWFKWIRHEPNTNYREEREAEYDGFTYVLAGVDPFWPEPIRPNAEGRYVFSDVVLMKRPLKMELEARIENAKLSRGMAQAKVNAFKEQLRVAEADIPQGLVDEMIGS